MKKRNLAFIDLETTGLNPTRQEIIELASVVVEQVLLEQMVLVETMVLLVEMV